jgi:phosphomannomutase/phosphoglucomutase
MFWECIILLLGLQVNNLYPAGQVQNNQQGMPVMQDVIFREYDIRGKVDTELRIDQVYDLTRAIVYYFKQHKPDIKTVAIGMDGRTHSPAIKAEMSRALIDSGLDVTFVGMCTSPALYFALNTHHFDAGLMITASHNTKEYNGIKICLGTKSIWGNEIRVIRELYKEKKHIDSAAKGTYTEASIIDEYVAWMVDHFAHLKNMDMSAVIDCGNGAAGTVMPQLVKAMGWKNVRLLYPEVDGTYPNHEADPVVEKNMQDVKNILFATDVQIGIGLDGDCDRMAPMIKQGFLVPGDQLLALFAQPIIQNHPGAGVVFDIKSSAGLIELLEQWGGTLHMSPSGHAIIKDTIKAHGALLGGELSCHFFFNDRYFGYDDGVYAALRLFEMLLKSGKTLDTLLEVFPQKYSSLEFRIPCPEAKKQAIIEKVKTYFASRSDAHLITMDGVRVTLPQGWGIVRASNTQPVLSMRFEGNTQDDLKEIKQDFIEALKDGYDKEELAKTFGIE